MNKNIINFPNPYEYIEEGSTILSCKIVEKFNSVFVRVIYLLDKEFQLQNNLWYQKRFVDILLIPGEDYKGASISGGGINEQ